jgi:hypothetical protein
VSCDAAPSLRERRAQLTRDEILRAARRLFAERGYARTSVRDIARAAGGSDDATEVAATSARVTRAILEHCGDIIHALATGAAAEPDLAAVQATGQLRHVDGAGMVIGLLQRLDALDESIEPEAAVDTLAAIADVRFALLLRESYGWSLDRIETWIAATCQALLLRK